ncbi:MAG: ribokinase [Oscillospiraceae bacterium]|nr:ribokinase [Oscillospiraceae bacterium]
MARPRILAVGSANMDIVLSMPRVPNRGESLIAEHYGYIPGGKGANAAIAAARLGSEVVFCARLGNDEHGANLIEAYKREKIDSRFIKMDKNAPTGLAAILLEDDGSNRIVVYPGANLKLAPDDVENAFLSYPDAVMLNFEIDPRAAAAATEFAQRQQIPVIIDAGPVRKDFPYEQLKQVEIISPNEIETAQITGISPVTAEECTKACMRLKNIVDAKYVVLKLSDKGSFLFDGVFSEYIPSHNVPVVDTTAAGDAFTAALTAEYLRTKDPLRACRYANVAGALTVTKYGASTSLPNEKDIYNFIAEREIKL